MKLYFIYQIANKAGVFDTPRLYAVTTNKKMMNTFLDSRYKDYFYTKKAEDVSRENYRTFRDTHSGYFLTETEFKTRSSEDVGIQKIKLIVTQYEDEQVFLNKEKVWEELAKHTSDYLDCFNDDLKKLLEKLHYYKIYEFYRVDQIQIPYGEPLPFDDYENIHLEFDEFSIFMFFFGSTMLPPETEGS